MPGTWHSALEATASNIEKTPNLINEVWSFFMAGMEGFGKSNAP